MERFLSPEPIVRLEKAFVNPFKTILTAARTCYSSRGIVREEDLKDGAEALAERLYRAGHHTTIEHAHFQFSLANVSRQFIWSFLHAHPFYNSEQVSQRYVEVAPGRVAIPPLSGESLTLYLETIEFQMAAYRRLAEKLFPIVEREYRRLFPHRRTTEKKYRAAIEKRCLEVARYVLPVATFAYLYHTISAITLLRYYRLCQQWDAPHEQRLVVGKMVQEVLRWDPLYARILEEPIPLEETPEFAFFTAHFETLGWEARRTFREEFDRSLDGHVSKLVDYKLHNEATLADAVRQVLGVPRTALDDRAAIELVLNPARNRLLGESLNLTTLSKLSRALHHPSYTFRKKLSHAADSQDQRHRLTPASRPCLTTQFSVEPDFITPELIRCEEKVERCYVETMERIWAAIARLRARGVRDEYAMYLLPNAVAIRYTESADLLNLRHKHAMRLCYLAQEEIWRASVDEARQIREVNPTIGKYLLPPCALRKLADTRPTCPEGERFCGVPVWRLDLSEYRRLI